MGGKSLYISNEIVEHPSNLSLMSRHARRPHEAVGSIPGIDVLLNLNVVGGFYLHQIFYTVLHDGNVCTFYSCYDGLTDHYSV